MTNNGWREDGGGEAGLEQMRQAVARLLDDARRLIAECGDARRKLRNTTARSAAIRRDQAPGAQTAER